MSTKFKIGDKVKIPTARSTVYKAEDSSAVKSARKLGQDFLYVTSIKEGFDTCTLGAKSHSYDSSFYIKDLELYEEPKKEPKYKVGDKVVPFKKTRGYGTLDESTMWQTGKDQGFLYIKELPNDINGKRYILSNTFENPIKKGGDYFNEDDFTPYQKEREMIKVGDTVECISIVRTSEEGADYIVADNIKLGDRLEVVGIDSSWLLFKDKQYYHPQTKFFKIIQNKQKQSVMKAKTFAISGKNHQLASILQDLLELGYVLHKDCSFGPEINSIVTNVGTTASGNTKEMFKVLYLLKGWSDTKDVSFTLPKQYSEVLEFAKEQLQDKYWAYEFKVGDWITTSIRPEVFGTGQISIIDYDYIEVASWSKGCKSVNFAKGSDVGKNIRLATPEEIKAAKLASSLTIGDYKAEKIHIEGVPYLKFGCLLLNKRDIETLQKIRESTTFSIKGVGISEDNLNVAKKMLTL